MVGGGLGGLWAALRAAENGYPVKLFSLFPVKRSHSCCAQGGINAVFDVKGQRDSIQQHIVDTIKGGDYLADQPPIKSMCEEAPGLIRAFDRMGVTFSRTPEGTMDQRLFGGVKNRRTCFAGATTGQQLLYAVDEQVRRFEADGKITKYEDWEFLSIVRDGNGTCRGIVAMNLQTMKLEAFRADAVILATGGLGLIWGRSTMSTNSTGAAAARVYQQGARFANGEFVQFHPTAIPGHDKNRLMSEACRGEGGRIWVPRNAGDQRDPVDIPEAERFYFLEEWYPAYGNTVPRDIASRAIVRVVRHMGLGVGGKEIAYLDLSHRPRRFLEDRLGGILEMYQTFTGEDPYTGPMKIFPSMHYSMGGILVDYEKDGTAGGMKHSSPRNHATTIPGLYACGECDSGYHGANRLGANSLLSASFSGRVAGDAVSAYLKTLKSTAADVPADSFTKELARQQEINRTITSSSGPENPFALHHALGEIMQEHVFVERDNAGLDKAVAGIRDLKDRFRRITLDDSGGWTNQSLSWARQIYDMIVLAEVIAQGARLRDECRGSHFKPEFELKVPPGKFAGDPEYEAYKAKWKANNEKWLKATVATWTPDGPQFEFKPVDLSVMAPEQPRDYR
ncbi:MAG TPA: succinate dehydrogenase (quinone) flavoprotein subunit [Phycisphaerae bacterium]|nr:succinate dehydrogenase (quinone) flavoprotein subunit [Phycisphaerae bacterium]HNU43996.1 succinate dehydrogenase (quinone) flavoprotein subunit [Phycisphaerae bacterium]